MGLAERRAAKNFETNRFPQLKKELDTAAFFDIPLEVDWTSLSVDGYADSYEEFWSKVYFQPLVQALRAITIDDMGKEALKAGLKKVVIRNTAGIYYADRMAHFVDGVLTLDHEPATNVDDVGERTKGIQKALEEKL